MKLIINTILAMVAITSVRASDPFLVRDLYDAGMPLEQAEAIAEAIRRQEAITEKAADDANWEAEKAQIKAKSAAMLEATFKRAMGQ
jgi:hypothetical protein